MTGNARITDFREDGEGRCSACGSRFPYMMIHNGFNESASAYCDSCGRTALLDLWSAPSDVSLTHGPVPSEVESRLAPCACGGRFRAIASPRCPACREPLDAQAAATYIEANALGTEKGGLWQRSWQGLYCLVVERPPVRNAWLDSPLGGHRNMALQADVTGIAGAATELWDVSQVITAGYPMKMNKLIPMLPVRSMPASVDFYQKLGFKTEKRDDGWRWAMLCSGECRLMVDESINVHPGVRTSVLYLYPDDISDFHRQVRGNGLVVPDLEVTFYGMTEFRIEDPDGNRLWIGQDLRAGNSGPADANVPRGRDDV